jgi:mannose-1-phosphate guanylyltransferase
MLATAEIFLQNPQAVVAALPADHLIKNQALFMKKLEAGAEAASRKGCFITFGIRPTFASTGFGYIQFTKKEPSSINGETFYSVQKFKEKPKQKQADEFFKSGNFYWNSGMFLWQAEVFEKKLKRYAPSLYPFWEKMIEGIKDRDPVKIASVFEEIPSDSIDYALMEEARGVFMCEGDFGWSDVGSWSALSDIWPKDDNNNALRGESIIFDSKNCLLHNPNKITALIGVEDIFVVDTDDALIICRKDMDQKVKDVVEEIKEKKKIEYL